MASSSPSAPDYGIDAPEVVRNLLLIAAAGIILWAVNLAGVWSGLLTIPAGPVRLVFPLASMGRWAAVGCTAMAGWMLWSSKIGKRRERERLLDHITWTGREQVLDVGCGRGLMLVGAAKRLTSGRAIGIDIWQAEDLSGNLRDATLDNARREGVSDRIMVETADMRELPFPEAIFDVVVSKAAIHNLYSAPDRAKAIAEIARVLKPGGQALIDDIRHLHEYVDTFAANGCREVQWLGSPVVRALLAVITVGSLRPSVVLVRKSPHYVSFEPAIGHKPH